MSNSFPISPDYMVPDSFDDLMLQNQAPHFPVTFSGMKSRNLSDLEMNDHSIIQSRKEMNLSRSLKLTSNLIAPDDSPLYPNFREPTTDSYKWGSDIHQLSPESVTDCMRRLSQLSIDLFEHSKTVPPQSIHDPDHISNQKLSEDYDKYTVEDTFRLTQDLVEIYPRFMAAFFTSETNTPSFTSTEDNISTGSSEFSTQATPSPADTQRTQPEMPFDHSSVLLILSCHLRLISVYDELFKHMKRCIIQKGIALTPQQARLTSPQMKIGSYTPPPSSAVPMQMLLLIQFSTQLFHYAADLASEVRRGEPSSSTGESENESVGDMALAMARAAADNVESRAKSMSQELGDMRSQVLRGGMLA